MLHAFINDLAQRCLTLNKMEQRAQLKSFFQNSAFLPGAGVLDFGCGTALFAPMFHRMGLAYNGYDIEPRLIRYARCLYPWADFVVSRYELQTLAPFSLILINCCSHYIPDDLFEQELVFLKSLLVPGGACLLVDILKVPETDDTALHQLFMKLEQGQFVRSRDGYLSLMSRHFAIHREAVWRSHLFSLPGRFNPLYNDLVVIEGRLMEKGNN